VLDETLIPPDYLPRARRWYATQLSHLKTVHGFQWPENREWLEDYLNVEVQELIWSEVQKDAI